MNVNKCKSDVGETSAEGPNLITAVKELMSDSFSKWTATLRLSVYTQRVIESSLFGAIASYGTHVIHLRRASYIYQIWDQSVIVPVFARVSRCLCAAYMCETYATIWEKPPPNQPIPRALEECRWRRRRGGEVYVEYVPPLYPTRGG